MTSPAECPHCGVLYNYNHADDPAHCTNNCELRRKYAKAYIALGVALGWNAQAISSVLDIVL